MMMMSGNQIFTPGRQPGPQDRSSRVSPGLTFSASIKNNSLLSKCISTVESIAD